MSIQLLFQVDKLHSTLLAPCLRPTVVVLYWSIIRTGFPHCKPPTDARRWDLSELWAVLSFRGYSEGTFFELNLLNWHWWSIIIPAVPLKGLRWNKGSSVASNTDKVSALTKEIDDFEKSLRACKTPHSAMRGKRSGGKSIVSYAENKTKEGDVDTD